MAACAALATGASACTETTTDPASRTELTDPRPGTPEIGEEAAPPSSRGEPSARSPSAGDQPENSPGDELPGGRAGAPTEDTSGGTNGAGAGGKGSDGGSSGEASAQSGASGAETVNGGNGGVDAEGGLGGDTASDDIDDPAAGGTAGMDPDAEVVDPTTIEIPYGCADNGELYCYGTNQRVQLFCEDYTLYYSALCTEDERCDTRPQNRGQCEPMLPECVGQTPYVGFCVGDTYVECGVDLLDRVYDEVCSSECVPRAGDADCIQSGCGDGTVGSGEACDDGNNTSGDGCSATCNWDPALGEPLEDVSSFGAVVGLSGDTIVVTAYDVLGFPELFVFRQDGPAYRLEAVLGVAGDARATNQEADALYMGHQLELEGDTLAVCASGTNEDPVPRVLVYERSGTSWSLQTELTALELNAGSAPNENANFCSSLALSGDTLVVGDPYDFDLGDFAGAAYVFSRQSGDWQSVQKLYAMLPDGSSDAEASAVFGSSVAVSGERIVVGSLGKEGATFQTGAAYVYVQEAGSWIPEFRFMPPQPSVIDYDTGGPQCGSDVAISGDTLVVGCHYDWEMLPPSSNEERSKYAGSAYALERGSSGWAERVKVGPSEGTQPNDDRSLAQFGFQVDVADDGSWFAVGGHSDATSGASSGSVHVFRRGGSNWALEQKLVHIPDRGEPGGGSGAQSGFGTSLAISGDRLAVAGPTTERGGRAFLYEFSEAQWQLRLELQAVEP